MSKFWGIYNSNFQFSEDDLEAAAVSLFDNHIERLRASEVSSIVSVLDKCEIASEDLVKKWVDVHRDDNEFSKSIENYTNLILSDMKDALEDKEKHDFEKDLQSLLVAVNRGRLLPDSSVTEWLSQQEDNQYEKFLEDSDCPDLLENIRSYMSIANGGEKYHIIQQKLILALREIGKDSLFRRNQITNMLEKDIFVEET